MAGFAISRPGAHNNMRRSDHPRTERAVILKDFSRILLEELDADCPLPGDATRRVSGLAIDEPIKGWISRDRVAVTDRDTLDEEFMKAVASAGSPAIVSRREGAAQPEAVQQAAALSARSETPAGTQHAAADFGASLP